MKIFPDKYTTYSQASSSSKAAQDGQASRDFRAAAAAAEAAKPPIAGAPPDPWCAGLSRGENAYANSLKFPDNGPQRPRPAA